MNLHAVPFAVVDKGDEAILAWIREHPDTDACVCDCCGDGESGWHHDEPGQHREDTFGMDGPYAYNGGFPECA